MGVVISVDLSPEVLRTHIASTNGQVCLCIHAESGTVDVNFASSGIEGKSVQLDVLYSSRRTTDPNEVVEKFAENKEDANIERRIAVRMGGSIFDIVSRTGEILVAKELLNYEVKNHYQVPIVITDNGYPSLSSQRILNIYVNDQIVTIMENSAKNTPVSKKISALDVDNDQVL